MNRENKNKKKSNPFGFIVALAIIIIGNLADAADSGAAAAVIVLVIIMAAIGLFVAAIVKSAKKNGQSTGFSSVSKSFSAKRSFTPAEPAAVKSPELKYYDGYNSQELSERDRQRRLSQLEGFLKNGIIEKEEYYILKARYERNGK